MEDTTKLAIFEIVIYIPIAFVAKYLLFKHGRHGILGWLCFSSFTLLRILAGILQVIDWHKEKKHEHVGNAASIVNSIGLSALLLASAGVLHEAATYEYNHRRVLGWIIALHIHVAVAVGVILGVIGGIKLFSANTQAELHTDKGLLIAGSLITVITVSFILSWAAFLVIKLKRTSELIQSRAVHSALTLTYGVIAALAILLVRVIYGIVFAFTLKRSLSPYAGTFAVKLVFITLVQLFAALSLLFVGLQTHDINREAAEARNPITYDDQGPMRQNREVNYQATERPTSQDA